MKQLLLGLVACTAVSAAQAEIIDIAWGADGLFSRRHSIAAGKLVEVCGPLPAAARVAWRFEGSAPLDFNIHYHVGKEVVFPAKLAQTARAQDTLLVALAQDYCWMWSNKGAAAATLSLTLQR